MRNVRTDRYFHLLVISGLAAAAIAAMYSGSHHSAKPGPAEAAWWLGADLEPAGGQGGGVRIKRVWSRSPASTSKLAIGDVILQINGTPVSSANEVETMLSAPDFQRTAMLEVLKSGQIAKIPVALRERPNFLLNSGIILLVLAAVFALLYFSPLERVAVVGCGAVFSVVLGIILNFYNQENAFEAIRMNTLGLLFGMGLMAAALEETGFFQIMVKKAIRFSHGDWSRLMVLLCLITFLLSTYVNNLTTIMLVLPVTLGAARTLGFDPAPFVIGELISSNLGGGSSMIGDFPNMLIASESGRSFQDFLFCMMPPCLFLLGVTIWYMKRRAPQETGAAAAAALAEINSRPEAPLAKGRMSLVFVIQNAALIAFPFCAVLGIPPATVALAGGFLILLLWNRAAGRLLVKGGFADIIFFSGLFVLAGCAEASGLVDIVASWLVDVSGGGARLLALLLMWTAALATAFLSAIPATALFVPIVSGLGVCEPHGLLWWALCLGLCAGSSATLTGATAGPVALTRMETFMKDEAAAGTEPGLSFVSYARAGVPLALIFLLFSSAYLWGLSLLSP
jgi:Na+/H+ antiporter NhaD/arsenite permease-like protein